MRPLLWMSGRSPSLRRVKILLDENLPRRMSQSIVAEGHDVVHVEDVGLRGEADEVVFRAALDQGRVLVTADTDFGAILALSAAPFPSVVLLRGGDHGTDKRARRIIEVLVLTQSALLSGAVVVAEPGRLRIRRLPLHEE